MTEMAFVIAYFVFAFAQAILASRLVKSNKGDAVFYTVLFFVFSPAVSVAFVIQGLIYVVEYLVMVGRE